MRGTVFLIVLSALANCVTVPFFEFALAADRQHTDDKKAASATAPSPPNNDQERERAGSGPKSGKCFPSFPLNCVVTQKIDEHHLGLACNNAYIEPHGILQVAKVRNYKIGPMNTGVQYIKTKTMKLDNGFDAPVDIWQECQWGPTNH